MNSYSNTVGMDSLIRYTVNNRGTLIWLTGGITEATNIPMKVIGDKVMKNTLPYHGCPWKHTPLPRVYLYLQLGWGSPNISRSTPGSVNTELRQEHDMEQCIGDSKFLTFHKQGTVIFLVREESFEGTDVPDVHPPIPFELINSGHIGERTRTGSCWKWLMGDRTGPESSFKGLLGEDRKVCLFPTNFLKKRRTDRFFYFSKNLKEPSVTPLLVPSLVFSPRWFA